ncbi:hypothetical protein [Blastopirellula marina]|uniref:Uncharacterized protein n=1 Tax=Blastopirellula marina TaxID=124 RepID=A0A2S8F9W9_9BACT|nr:hypothetical protein [Blastopirellula marina]PQO28932.1 hypothetical protein C5Y98_24540 [Blastopirellula marina]PTL42205.1 hypothetical protein C5Y97_24555 [Blastopirellula marina]
MKAFTFIPAICLLLSSTVVYASPASALVNAIAKFVSKEAAETGAKSISKEVGSEVVERVSVRLVQEGGEKAVTEAAELASKHGPDVIRALDNAPGTTQILKSLDELPVDEVGEAAARLASGSRGKQLAKATDGFGVDALQAELKHPGAGLEYVTTWGKEGGTLCRSLTFDEAILLGKHLDDIAKLPPAQKHQLLELIESSPKEFFAWLGRFIEANPGKTIGSATLLAVVLPNSDRILGGDEVVFDSEGNPVVVSKKGLLSNPVDTLTESATDGVSWLFKGIAIVIVSALAIYAAIKLWYVWRRESRHA